MDSEQLETPEITDEDLAKYRVLVNDCDHYQQEYKNCTTISARFHQRYVHGEDVDCTPMKDDYNNCLKWKQDKDESALNNVTTNELKRLRERIQRTLATSQIWELRKEPPSDLEWSPPLPHYLQTRAEKSMIGLRDQRTKACALM